MSITRIAVLGLGKVGLLAARLLADSGMSVVGVDRQAHPDQRQFDTRELDVAVPEVVDSLLAGTDAVLSCLPYHLNAQVAKTARRSGIHYFDLTEDVRTTELIQDLAADAATVMAPQCGLAPGLVGIVAAHLAGGFDRCRSLRMRVGALPRNPTGLLGYAFNWSPEGVVNEYLNDCEVIEDGERKWVSSMEWHETLYVNGERLEAFTTSGGIGTMCDTYHGEIDNIDYKTLRYPGHVDLMNFFFHELLMREHRDQAGKILTNAKPPVDDDVVHVHVAAEGHRNGRLHRDEHVRSYYPRELLGERHTAISWTTAASAVAVIEMVRRGALPDRGFLRQERIPLDCYLQTPTGALFAEDPPRVH